MLINKKEPRRKITELIGQTKMDLLSIQNLIEDSQLLSHEDKEKLEKQFWKVINKLIEQLRIYGNNNKDTKAK